MVISCLSVIMENVSVVRLSRAAWRSGLPPNVEVVGSSPIKGTRCFLEQVTLPLLLSTGWF